MLRWLFLTPSQDCINQLEQICEFTQDDQHNNKNEVNGGMAMMNFKGQLASHALAVFALLGFATTASAQSWIDQSAMKVARVEATTIDYRDNIYVFNGFKPGIRIAESVEKYDSSTKQWSLIGSSSVNDDSAMTHNGAVRVGVDVWLIGGRVGSHPGRVSNKVWIYNLDSNKWRRGPDLPVPSAAGGAALVNNKIHWIGGIDADASCDVANHFVYDLDKPSAGWNNITATAGMPSPRNHFSTAAVNGIIYVMGGQYGHDACPGKMTQDTPLVHAFNPANNQWSQKADMPNKNSHSEPGTFVYKDDIYTTGGENAGDKVWKYSPSTNKWSTFRTLPETLVAPVARIVGGNLIVAGGGAPRAALATDRVRSMTVDNNPPTQEPEPTQQPVTEPPVPEPGSQTPEGATLISMEAEYFDISTKTSSHQWVHVARGNSSNDDAMITTPDQGELASSIQETPMLSYMVYFNYPGKHYIWVRGSGDSNNAGVGSSDSIHVGLNGTVASSAYRIDQFPSEWTWSRNTPSNPIASVNVVNAGVNVVNFWMREDGLAFDKFVITSDQNYKPENIGPQVTDGTDGYVAPSTNEAVDSNPNSDDSIDMDIADVVQVEVVSESVTAPTKDDLVGSVFTNDEIATILSTNNNPLNMNTSFSDVINADPKNDALVESGSIVDDQFNGVNDDADSIDQVAVDTNLTATNTHKGLFGGSASSASLLALLALCFIRVGRATAFVKSCVTV